MEAVGPKIRKLREIQDLTQEYMATQLGISQAAYSKISARGERHYFLVAQAHCLRTWRRCAVLARFRYGYGDS